MSERHTYLRPGYYTLISQAEPDPVLVHVYHSTDMNCMGVGFNVHDGAGFVPLVDITEDSIFEPVQLHPVRKTFTPPPVKLNPAAIEDTIKNENYLVLPDKQGIICILQLHNGCKITGFSACVREETYVEDIGKDVARKKAVEQIWQLEGYLLLQRWYEHEHGSIPALLDSDNNYDLSIHSNPDARAWAEFYCQIVPDADPELMFGWFANAMMAMHDYLHHAKPIDQAEQWRDAAIKLWDLLDNIDTLEDMCKSDDKCFRTNARTHFDDRHKLLVSDGYTLELPYKAADSINRLKDDEIIELVRTVMDNGTGTAETANEHVLLKLMELRGTPMESFEFDREKMEFHFNQYLAEKSGITE